MTMTRTKIVLYNPKSTFYTMPLALVALGSALDRARFEVQIIDGRLEKDPVAAVLAEIDNAVCLGMTVLTGAPIRDACSRRVRTAAAYPSWTSAGTPGRKMPAFSRAIAPIVSPRNCM